MDFNIRQQPLVEHIFDVHDVLDVLDLLDMVAEKTNPYKRCSQKPAENASIKSKSSKTETDECCIHPAVMTHRIFFVLQ